MDGLILGAAAGMGFAALEDMCYTSSALMASGGSLSTTVGIALLRGLFSPVGHGTWIAVLVSIMSREASPAHFRITRSVLGAYLLVVAMHGTWNAGPMLMSGAGGGPATLLPQLLAGVVGLFILSRRWREAVVCRNWRPLLLSRWLPSPDRGRQGISFWR